MKKQQLKDIITNQNELIEYWRTRASGFERLHDQTDRILRVCENRNEELSGENKRLKEQIGEIRECRDLEIEGIRKQHEFNTEQDRKEIERLKAQVTPRKPMSPKVDYDLGALAKTFRRFRRDFDGNEPLSYSLIVRVVGILEQLGYSGEE